MRKEIIIIFLIFIINLTFAIVSDIDNIFEIDLNKYQCDEVISDSVYYFPGKGEYKVYWYEFENKSNKPLYFFQWKTQIVKGLDLVNLNFSFIEKKDLDGNIIWSGIDLFVFNYPYLCKNGFKINTGEKVRILTTSEEVGTYKCEDFVYNTKFTLWTGKYDLGVVSENVLPYRFIFNTPILGVKSKGGDNIFSFRLGILYDEDNDLTTLKDNKLKITCYETKILYCGDGIVSTEYGEECDPADPNDDGTCKINCKKECIVSENDIDGDCVPNEKDLAPRIPEDFDKYEDEDGLPDIDVNIPQVNIINNLNCNMCPCPFAGLNSSLWNHDIVKASLWGYEFNIPYIWSPEKIFQGYPE